jgi:hypothetical protein
MSNAEAAFTELAFGPIKPGTAIRPPTTRAIAKAISPILFILFSPFSFFIGLL